MLSVYAVRFNGAVEHEGTNAERKALHLKAQTYAKSGEIETNENGPTVLSFASLITPRDLKNDLKIQFGEADGRCEVHPDPRHSDDYHWLVTLNG